MTSFKTYKKIFINGFLVSFFICVYPAFGGGVRTACKKAFMDQSFVFNSAEFKNPLSKVLIKGHQQARDLKFLQSLKILRKRKQNKMFDKGLREMLKFLERSSTRKEAEVLSRLDVSMEDAINNVSKIMEFVESLPEGEALYYRRIAQAVLAVFSKHVPIMLRHPPSALDIPRMRLILKDIAEFDPQRPRYSLYKIKRSIEGRYSMREFILCKV